LHPKFERVRVALARVRADDAFKVPRGARAVLEAGHDRVGDASRGADLDLPDVGIEAGCAAHVPEVLKDGSHAISTLRRRAFGRWRLSGTDEVMRRTGNISV
jgi:hypothetical protein